MMSVAVTGVRGASRKGYTRVLDSSRIVGRLDRILSPDRASISSQSRRRWQNQQRDFHRDRNAKTGSAPKSGTGRYQSLGRAFRPLAASQQAKNPAMAQASVHQHIASGGPVRGTLHFEYPINLGGQPRLVEGQLEFEAAVEGGQPFVTIPLADNINLKDSPSRTYRASDQTELGMVAQEAVSREMSPRPNSAAIHTAQSHAAQASAPETVSREKDPKGLKSVRGRFQTTRFNRESAIRAYRMVAANDDFIRPGRRALTVA
jgi:hypothetical protein